MLLVAVPQGIRRETATNPPSELTKRVERSGSELPVDRLTSERLLFLIHVRMLLLVVLLLVHLLLLLLVLHRGHQIDRIELVQTELFGCVLLAELTRRGRTQSPQGSVSRRRSRGHLA